MGPSFDVICNIINYSRILCRLINLQNSQFENILQTVKDIWKISKLAYQGKKINETFFYVICEVISYSCIICILRNSQFANISQMVWDLWKNSKLAYEGKKINEPSFHLAKLLIFLASFAYLENLQNSQFANILQTVWDIQKRFHA